MLINQYWQLIESWLAAHAPATYATLGAPAQPAELAEAQRALGVIFPADLIDSLLRHDGTGSGPAHFTLPGGYRLMSVADMLLGLRWRNRDQSGAGSAAGTGDSGRVPFAANLAVDCRTDRRYGAVARIGAAGDRDGAGWPSVGALLAEIAEALPAGLPVDGRVPYVFAGRLGWVLAAEQVPAPRSVLALAQAATGVAQPTPSHIWPRQGAGWIGGYGAFC